MGWRTEWKALSARIEGLLNAGRFFAQLYATKSSDPYGTGKKVLLPHAKSICDEIMKYKETYGQYLPDAAKNSITNFEISSRDLLNSQDNINMTMDKVKIVLPWLASLSSEINYYLSDMQEIAKRITERAFIHLQRLIIADEDIQRKWRKAFDDGEPACERLGAAHLLLHGIWAFKASGEGERTDLILGQPIRESQVESTAEALVLTEWKMVRSPEKLDSKVEEALKQALIYGDSLLGGIELAGYRYLVLVSKDRIEIPTNRIEKDVTYRCINIAVEPSVPSEASRKKSSGKS